ncbi:MAG: hypothetical protein AAB011_13755 [Candidatus Eisenbacteria bacterium]
MSAFPDPATLDRLERLLGERAFALYLQQEVALLVRAGLGRVVAIDSKWMAPTPVPAVLEFEPTEAAPEPTPPERIEPPVELTKREFDARKRDLFPDHVDRASPIADLLRERF